ncbi:MAG: site-specific integrase [Hyphomicrobium sp.]|nr:site-specific integrase [Hyphomicrobium sp.]
MPAKKPSRNTIDGKIHVIRKGLAVYKVHVSPYYRVRVWVPSEGRYLVKSTKTLSKISAIDAAEEYLAELRQRKFVDAVPKSRLFSTYADKLIDRQRRLAADGEIHPKQATNDESILLGEGGVVPFFGKRDVRTIRSKDITAYLDHLRKGRSKKLASSILNKKLIALRKVLKIAYEEGVLASVPDTPSLSRQDPRLIRQCGTGAPLTNDQSSSRINIDPSSAR